MQRQEDDSKYLTVNTDEYGVLVYLKPIPVGFNTREERFKNVPAVSPGCPLTIVGPASYTIEPLSKTKAKGLLRRRNRETKANAPSIPSHESVFGYAKTEGIRQEQIDGEVVRQPGPCKVFTGEGNDRVGPGHYDVKKNSLNRNKGTNWHASNVTRKLPIFLKASREERNIGPGTYDAKGNSTFTRRSRSFTRENRVVQGFDRTQSDSEDSECETQSDQKNVHSQTRRTKLLVQGTTIPLEIKRRKALISRWSRSVRGR